MRSCWHLQLKSVLVAFRTGEDGESPLGGERAFPGRVQDVYLVGLASDVVEFAVEIFSGGLVSLLEAVAQEPAQDRGLPDARRAEHHNAPAVLRLCGAVRLVRERLETRLPVQHQRGQLVQRRLPAVDFPQTGRAHHPRFLLLLLQVSRGQFQDAHSRFGERADFEPGRAESLRRVFVREEDAGRAGTGQSARLVLLDHRVHTLVQVHDGTH